ncbi:MAG: hypothetical protein ABI083_09090 [Lapillicoccus sp.]
MNPLPLEHLARRRVADRLRTRPATGIRRSARLIQLDIYRSRHAPHV